MRLKGIMGDLVAENDLKVEQLAKFQVKYNLLKKDYDKLYARCSENDDLEMKLRRLNKKIRRLEDDLLPHKLLEFKSGDNVTVHYGDGNFAHGTFDKYYTDPNCEKF